VFVCLCACLPLCFVVSVRVWGVSVPAGVSLEAAHTHHTPHTACTDVGVHPMCSHTHHDHDAQGSPADKVGTGARRHAPPIFARGRLGTYATLWQTHTCTPPPCPAVKAWCSGKVTAQTLAWLQAGEGRDHIKHQMLHQQKTIRRKLLDPRMEDIGKIDGEIAKWVGEFKSIPPR